MSQQSPRSLNVINEKGQKVPYMNLPDKATIELQKQYARNWIWRAVAALVEVQDFAPSLDWISERLQITKAEVAQALEGLLEMGILRKTDSGYERVLKYVFYGHHDLGTAHLVGSHALMSQQILNRLDPAAGKDESRQTDYRTVVLASNPQVTKELFEKVENLMREYLKKSSIENSEEVYALTFTGVSLTKNQSRNQGDDK